MKKPLTLVALLCVAACSSSKAGTPPVISNFQLQSPIMASSPTVKGSVVASDGIVKWIIGRVEFQFILDLGTAIPSSSIISG